MSIPSPMHSIVSIVFCLPLYTHSPTRLSGYCQCNQLIPLYLCVQDIITHEIYASLTLYVVNCMCPYIAACIVGTHWYVVYMYTWKSRKGIIPIMFILYIQNIATNEPIRQHGGKDGMC